MSSKTLSAVIEKKIRRLCLKDFPCGNGPWRRSKTDPNGAGTESPTALMDLLKDPKSPWRNDDLSWSPQASELRELAVRDPGQLSTHFIHNYFTTLRILGKDVSVVDKGLLKFSKLEELVLSANLISEIPAENLPPTLKILELRANQLSSLSGLTNCPPPPLQYLGIGSSSLGSHQDVYHLTGRHWPQLVCLDLSDCEFQEHQALLTALKTLPSLRTLMLKGNPFTLAPAYPGFTVDSLPQLFCLDSWWISAEDRRLFHGLARMNDLIENVASVTVSLSSLRGIPDPLMNVDQKAPDFPVINYTYFISYQFLDHLTSDNQGGDSESKLDTTSHETEDDSDLQLHRNGETEVSILHAEGCAATSGETKTAHLSQYRTSKLAWSSCSDFSHTVTHMVSSLGDLKRFFIQGLCLNLEEEKTLSWPAASIDAPLVKPSKGTKGKREEVKSASTKEKKSKCAPELVQDPPIRRVLASAHIPLQSLVHGSQRVSVFCDFGPLQADSEVEETWKDPEKKIKGEKRKEKEPKQRESSGTAQKNPTASKAGKSKGPKKPNSDDDTNPSVTVQQEPVTVELVVELEKWKTASEAHRFRTPASESHS